MHIFEFKFLAKPNFSFYGFSAYLKYLNLLLTKPIVQHPLSIAFVAPGVLVIFAPVIVPCPLLPIEDKVTIEPLLEGITATVKGKINNQLVYFSTMHLKNIKQILKHKKVKYVLRRDNTKLLCSPFCF